jgi:hypothetical protein
MTDTTQTGVSQTPVAESNAFADDQRAFDGLADQGILGDAPLDPRERRQDERTDERPDPRAADEQGATQGNEGEQTPPEGEEAQGEQYASLEEYFQKANVDFEAIRALPVTVKIDGQTKAVPLADVLKSYQLEGHVNNKSMQLSEAQRAFEAERQQAQAFVQSQFQAAQQLGQLAQQQLLGEYQAINWDQLRIADPAQWAVKQMDFQQRQAQIQNHLQQTQAALTQSQQQAQQQMQQQLAANLPKEQEKLIQYRPEWTDQIKFSADRTAAVSAGRKLGFSDAEISQWANWDSRFLIALDKIARFDALQAAAPEAAKRVRAAPPMARPGVRTNRNPAQATRQQARDRFVANPRDEDAGAAFFDTLI